MVAIKTENKLLFAVGVIGFTSIITQTILLREFLTVFSGNELVIGIVLANWMILTGIGSYAGKYFVKISRSMHGIMYLQMSASIFPWITVFLLYFLRNMVFPVGTMIGIWESVYCSAILLTPYCFLTGILFTLYAQFISEKNSTNQISRVYSFEATGSIVGGALFNLLFVFFLTTFQALTILCLVNLGIGYFLSKEYCKQETTYIVMFLGVLAVCIIIFFNVDGLTRHFLYPDQELLFYKDTPYGNLTVTKKGEQVNFYENSLLLFSTGDVTANEEAVHYAMIQHPDPKRVLLVSGGISGTIKEILKYDVQQLDYVEINPWIIMLGKNYTDALNDSRIRILIQDARMFVRTTNEQFDVVLLNVPDPVTAQLNRYFTLEFFRQVKTKLQSNGVVSASLTSSAEYMSDETREVNSILYNTLHAVFSNVLIVPGFRDYYLASDRPLDIHITRLIRARGIQNLYVNQNYLDDDLLQQRNKNIMQKIGRSSILNRDFAPISYFRQLQLWLSYFDFNPWILGVVGAAVMIIVILKMNPVSIGMFTGGFAATSIEILLLMSFQITYGYVYQAMGAIITVFMSGLALGSYIEQKLIIKSNRRKFIGVQFAIAFYAILLPYILTGVNDVIISDVIMYAVYFILTFIIAFFIGTAFSTATKLLNKNLRTVAAELYSVDLTGSAIGAILLSVYLLPLFGVEKASFLIAGMMMLSACIQIIKGKRFSTS